MAKMTGFQAIVIGGRLEVEAHGFCRQAGQCRYRVSVIPNGVCAPRFEDPLKAFMVVAMIEEPEYVDGKWDWELAETKVVECDCANSMELEAARMRRWAMNWRQAA